MIMAKIGRLLKQIRLNNGLILYFEDHSREATHGHRQVRLLVRMPITPAPEHFSGYEDPERALREFMALADGPVEYRVEKIRNFVDEKKAEKALDQMTAEFESGMDYLENPKFTGAYLRKKFEEMRKAKEVSELHREWIRKSEEK